MHMSQSRVRSSSGIYCVSAMSSAMLLGVNLVSDHDESSRLMMYLSELEEINQESIMSVMHLLSC